MEPSEGGKGTRTTKSSPKSRVPIVVDMGYWRDFLREKFLHLGETSEILITLIGLCVDGMVDPHQFSREEKMFWTSPLDARPVVFSIEIKHWLLTIYFAFLQSLFRRKSHLGGSGCHTMGEVGVGFSREIG